MTQEPVHGSRASCAGVISILFNFVHKKCIWTDGAIGNVAYCCIVIIEYTLVKKQKAQLLSSDRSGIYHIFVYNLAKSLLSVMASLIYEQSAV